MLRPFISTRSGGAGSPGRVDSLRSRGRRLAAALLFASGTLIGVSIAAPATADAQGTTAILIDGNAVVTGFSGTQPPLPFPPSATDQVMIDINGPSARIVDLQAPGAPPQAQLLSAPKPFTVYANQIGQVFSVTLDNATPPNIYVAATSSYGLPIVVGGPNGTLMRATQGGPNASFMPGLFGPPEQGGGPGSIWRIDGATGQVRLFANVALDGVANSGPALGGLAFDPGSSTLFAADRETGMIHRFDLSGREVGRFDHGVQARLAAGLPAVAYDPARRLDITNPRFQAGDPSSWGYTSPERLIFGLAVRSGRLYYAVADGLQVWSVSLAEDGSFGTDPRIEIQVTPWDGGSEISKITFDNAGHMFLAERGAPTGAYDFAALAKGGVGRVLRYRSAAPPAGGPATWRPDPEQYAIGFAGEMRNANGGVAIGYGYTADGRIDRAACGSFLWSTAEELRRAMDPTLMTRLAATGPAIVNGLQGNGIDLVRPANVPPLASYFLDYDDMFQDDPARGHMGDIAIRRTCGQALAPMPLPIAVGGGGFIAGGGFCLPGELRLLDGQCCDRRFVRDGRCFPPPSACPPDEIRLPGGQCCNPREVRDGRCGGCPPDEIRLPNGQCCNPREVRDGRCGGCPPDEIRLPNGQCCNPREVRDGRCGGCPPDDIRLPTGQCCPRRDVRDGRCVPPPSNCPSGEILLPNGQCCPRSDVQNGQCIQIQIRRHPTSRRVRVTEPQEPTVYVPGTFHHRIPTGIVPRVPVVPPRGTIGVPRINAGNNTLR
ncbi:MAG TPA: hypothetical protein VKW08_12935 [Xanthobacteraceae bacterium]|nr:hypothetical protein [Xanthobacteraceae bacterium]